LSDESALAGRCAVVNREAAGIGEAESSDVELDIGAEGAESALGDRDARGENERRLAGEYGVNRGIGFSHDGHRIISASPGVYGKGNAGGSKGIGVSGN
jgi:hypothetical protein